MRYQILSVLAAASVAVNAQSSTVPAPQVTNPAGVQYVATLPEKEGSTVRGSISGTPSTDGTGVKFSISISGLPAEGGPFMYHIHEKPIPSDGNCSGAGAHLDPYKRGEVPLCDASKPETCQTGDLSGKFGNITAQEWSQEYVDLYSATRLDSAAYFGNLSVVVHLSDKKRIACANFTMVSADTETSTTTSSLASGVAQPTGSGASNSFSSAPTGTASTTGSPSSSPSVVPFTGNAAGKLVSGTAAFLAVAAALVL